MTPLLSVRGLSVQYRHGNETVEALNDVSFDLAPGERLAIIGESGSGKSTLALALGGLLPVGSTVSGQILWPALGRQPSNGSDIGFVFQDPSGSLDPLMQVGDQIVEVLRANQHMRGADAKTRALQLIDRVALPEAAVIAASYPHQLSGGQRQRVAIACAIAAGPKFLIADEATSALDTVIQAEIMRLIEKLVREEGLALIFITHDIALASSIGERIVVLHEGRMIEMGRPETIISHPVQNYTRRLVSSYIALDASPMVRPLADALATGAQ